MSDITDSKRAEVMARREARIRPDGRTAPKKVPEARASFAGEETAQRRKRPVGRPPAAPGEALSVTASHAELRAMLAALNAAHSAPRAAETERLVKDAIEWIERRLGPAVDPNYIPERRRMRPAWVVTDKDGMEAAFQTIAEAALAYGVQPSSLAVTLSRGGGECSKVIDRTANPRLVKCRRISVPVE